jgi:glycosyltransferase involved in cell wall biosynthesis
MPHRILFVEQYYHPEGWGGAELPRDITMALRAAGHDVEVICGSDPYVPPTGDPAPDPRAAGVSITRIPKLLRGEARRLKFLRQLWFYVALVPILLLRRRPDLVIAQTNPPLSVVLLAAAAWLWRRPLVIIAQDVFPEVLTAHGMIRPRGPAERTLGAMFGRAYRSASSVVALGPVMRRRLEHKGVAPSRIVEISNWATGPIEPAPDDGALRRDWGLEGAFVLMYSGNLGIGHEFETLLDGLRLAAPKCPRLRLVVIGQGSRLAEVREGVAAHGLDDVVSFRGFVPAEQLSASLGLADLAIVTLRPGFEGLIVPSKLFGHMGRGIPTLYIGPESDVSVFLREADAGLVYATGEAAALAEGLAAACRGEQPLRACAERSRAAYEARFSRDRALAAYRQLVDQTLERGRR